MKKETLLEKALAVSGSRNKRHTAFRADVQDLAVAWFMGKINAGQASVASGFGVGNMGSRLAHALRNAILAGRYKIVKVEE